MPRFAANLSVLFTEYPFLERFDRAAQAGFRAVEFLFPYGEDVPAIREALSRNGLDQVLFNHPAGDFAAGDRGLASDPDRVGQFRDGVERALEIAAMLGCTRLNCLAGIRRANLPLDTQLATLADNLAFASERAQAAGVRQLVEPLNRYDAPGYLLGTTDAVLEMLDRAGHPNLWLQFDVYHCQRVEGNLVETFRRHQPRIAHVQIADSPARGQPGTGEINYPFVLRTLDEAGYDGWISLEYRPQGGTEASLSWLREWGYWR
jgi:hydroxypyruvate isomerase